MHFYNVAGDGVVDDTGFDWLLAFCLESSLVTIKLIAMTAYIMFATRFKYQIITTGTCFVVNNNVAIFSLPDKINVSTDYMTILIQVAERLFVVTLDGLSISFLERINKVVPCILDSLRLRNVLFGETIAIT